MKENFYQKSNTKFRYIAGIKNIFKFSYFNFTHFRDFLKKYIAFKKYE